MKRFSWLLGIGIVAVCIAFAGCKPTSVLVPEVLGLTQAAASASITGAGLAVGAITEEFSATVASGLVVSQSPLAGIPVSAGSAVALTVSKGPQPVTVPNVVGQAQAAASASITGAGLAVGAITEEFSATASSGLVISQSPVAGSSVSPGSAVALTVSKGPQPVMVPNVVGQAQAAASASIVNAGVTVGTITEEFSATLASGLVISQLPASGTSVSPGSAVALTVSKGPQPLTVPNLVGQTQAVASVSITGAGLTVGTLAQVFSADVASGLVVSQSPAADTPVSAGSAVALIVSKGPRPVIVPNEIWSLGDNVTLELVWIPGGTFTMGSVENEPGRAENEGPPHLVSVGGFWMSKYEVTQAQWRAITGKTPSHFTGDDLPVEQITWTECRAVLVKLCKEMGVAVDALRMPSEAEWEFACRAGSSTRWHFGDDLALLDDFAWSFTNGDNQTHPVGEKLPNDFGLYDMEGNVLEWCQDTWHGSYEGAPGDGSAWVSGDEQVRVLRGGAYDLDASGCRSAGRFSANEQTAVPNCGLRIVWSP